MNFKPNLLKLKISRIITKLFEFFCNYEYFNTTLQKNIKFKELNKNNRISNMYKRFKKIIIFFVFNSSENIL